MLFSARLSSMGKPTASQVFGGAKFPAFRCGKNLTVFAVPEQRSPIDYRLYILSPKNLSATALSREDIADYQELFGLPQVSKFVLSHADSSSPDEVFRSAVVQISELSEPDKVVANSLGDDFKGIYGDYPWYRWAQHARIVQPVLEGRYKELLPVTSEIAPTLNCIYRCGINMEGAGCSYKEAKKRHGLWQGQNNFRNREVHLTDWMIMKTIIDKLIAGGVTGLIFTGGGEPTLNKWTIPGMRYAKERDVQVELFTNGSALNEERINELTGFCPEVVRISLNAGTERAHRDHHNYLSPNAPHFKRILRNIEAFAVKRATLGSPLSFGVAYLISERNTRSLEPALELLLSIVEKFPGGIDYVIVRPEIDYYGHSRIDSVVLLHEIEVAKRLYGELERRGTSLRFLERIPAEGKVEKGYTRCLALRAFGEVGPSGKMFQCCDRNTHPDYEVGDLMNNTVSEIWRGTQYQALLDRMNVSDLTLCPPVCKPHGLNLIFSKIEKLRTKGFSQGVEEWILAHRPLPKHPLHCLL